MKTVNSLFSNQAIGKLVIPIFLDQVLLMFVGIVSTMMLSHAGEAAVSAVSMVDMFNMLIFNILSALDTGGAVIVSQYIGKNDKLGGCKGASQLISVTVLIALAIMLIVLFLKGPTLQLLFGSVTPDVMNQSEIYFLISSLSYPFLALYNSSAAIFRATGNSKVPMLISVMMNSLSLGGIALAVFNFHAGVTGVALAYFIARGIAALVILLLLSNHKNQIFIFLKGIFTWDSDMILRILKIAIPNGIENGLYQLGRILLISMIAIFGTTQIAANGITNTLVMFPISFATAMNLAIVAVVGRCAGAKEYQQAVSYTKRLLKLTYLITCFLCIAQLLLMPWILSFYTISSETKQLVLTLILIHNLLAILLWPLAFPLSNALRASGDVKFTMVISLISMFGFRIAFAYFLGIQLNKGVIGAWLAMGSDWSFRSLIFVLRFRSNKWKQYSLV